VVAAPTNLNATAVSSSQINLTWTDNATNETSYVVQRSTDGTNWSTQATLGANSTSYTDTSVAAGTTYYYRVQALDGTISSPYSNTASATTPSTVVLAPTNLNATAVSSSQINLTWTDKATNETGYTVQRSTNGTNWSTIATLGANSTSYADTGLASGTTYYYRVQAFNGTISSAYSNTASATTPSTIPAAPTNLTASVTGQKINLTWTDNASNETGFYVQRSTDNATWLTIATLGANTKSYSTTKPKSGLYYFRVLAYDSAGNSAPSNVISVNSSGVVSAAANPIPTTGSGDSWLTDPRSSGLWAEAAGYLESAALKNSDGSQNSLLSGGFVVWVSR
jgi:fibronectin type 3 domain-containing protein